MNQKRARAAKKRGRNLARKRKHSREREAIKGKEGRLKTKRREVLRNAVVPPKNDLAGRERSKLLKGIHINFHLFFWILHLTLYAIHV